MRRGARELKLRGRRVAVIVHGSTLGQRRIWISVTFAFSGVLGISVDQVSQALIWRVKG